MALLRTKQKKMSKIGKEKYCYFSLFLLITSKDEGVLRMALTVNVIFKPNKM